MSNLAKTLALLLTFAACFPSHGENAPEAPARNPAVKFEKLADGNIRLDGILLRRKEREIVFDGTINMTQGDLEVLIATEVGRLHESLLSTRISPLHLQTMLYLLDLENGPRRPDEKGCQGALVNIDLEWQDTEGKTVREPVENWVNNRLTGEGMKRYGWAFVGSSIADGVFLAEAEGNIALVYSVGNTILDIPADVGLNDTVFTVNPEKKQPGADAPVKIIITSGK